MNADREGAEGQSKEPSPTDCEKVKFDQWTGPGEENRSQTHLIMNQHKAQPKIATYGMSQINPG